MVNIIKVTREASKNSFRKIEIEACGCVFGIHFRGKGIFNSQKLYAICDRHLTSFLCILFQCIFSNIGSLDRRACEKC